MTSGGSIGSKISYGNPNQWVSVSETVCLPDGKFAMMTQRSQSNSSMGWWILSASGSPEGSFVYPGHPVVSIAPGADGNLLVSFSPYENGKTVHKLGWFTRTGTPVGSPIIVPEPRHIVALTNGDFAGAYGSSGQYDAFWIGPDLTLRQDTVANVGPLKLATMPVPMPDGGMALAWIAEGVNAGSDAIMVQRFNGDRTKRYR